MDVPRLAHTGSVRRCANGRCAANVTQDAPRLTSLFASMVVGTLTHIGSVRGLCKSALRCWRHTGCVKGFSHQVMRGRFVDVSVKIRIEPNRGIFDVSLKNDHASSNVKTP